MALHEHKKAPNTADESGHGSHMSSSSKADGGGPAPSGDGGNIHYPENEGTSEDKTGGIPPEKTDKSGLNVSTGKG